MDTKRSDYFSEHVGVETRSVVQRHPVGCVNILLRDIEADSAQGSDVCSACQNYDLNLCAAVRKTGLRADSQFGTGPLASSSHTIPARRMICHPKEWSEFVQVICHGWAASSITLPDGRRQILSFLLPGDIVSATYLLEPMSGRAVESVTEVTYRKFNRSDFKTLLFAIPNLLEKFSKICADMEAQSDLLAVDLGRRTADERISRLILRLANKIAMRGMMRDQTMDFPLRQKHIADATGLTPVHVSKVLGEFQRAGLIEISGRSLTIIDPTKLRRVADWR